MPVYRTGNNAYAIQQLGAGATGPATNTASFVGALGFFEPMPFYPPESVVPDAQQGAQEEASATPQVFEYTGSGGMTFGGAALVSRTKVVVGSGGITFGGAAVVTKTKVFVSSGGITFAGVAGVAKAKVFIASGGITFDGEAVVEFIPAGEEPPPPAGGGGGGGGGFVWRKPPRSFRLAPLSRPLPKIVTIVASGGIRFGGSASVKFIYDREREEAAILGFPLDEEMALVFPARCAR